MYIYIDSVYIYIHVYTHADTEGERERERCICTYIYILRKPASWIVAVCEQSEYKGGLGGGLAQVRQNLAITWGEGYVLGAFFRVMYHAAKG